MIHYKLFIAVSFFLSPGGVGSCVRVWGAAVSCRDPSSATAGDTPPSVQVAGLTTSGTVVGVG